MQLCHATARPGHPYTGAAHQNANVDTHPDAYPYANLYVDAYEYIYTNLYTHSYQYSYPDAHATPAGNYRNLVLLTLGRKWLVR